MLSQLPPLDLQLGLDQLALRGDGGVLTGGHGEGTGGETREAGDARWSAGHGPTGDTGHQREVGDQAVHGAEDGRPQPAAVHIAVGVVVAVGDVRWFGAVDDGHD